VVVAEVLATETGAAAAEAAGVDVAADVAPGLVWHCVPPGIPFLLKY
jgi:hypothetical protein